MSPANHIPVTDDIDPHHVAMMRRALKEADKAERLGEVPIGCVITGDHAEIIATGYNQPITDRDPTGHAEIKALRKAGMVVGNYRMRFTTLYVTIEPCVMCAGAISQARVGRVFFGAPSPGYGAVINGVRYFDHVTGMNRPDEIYSGLLADEAAEKLQAFFRRRRNPPEGEA